MLRCRSTWISPSALTAPQPSQLYQQPRDSRILEKSSVSLCDSGKCSQERPIAVTSSAWCCRQTRCRSASMNLLNSLLKPILTFPAPFSPACCSQGWGGDRATREESLGSVFTGKRGTEIAGHLPPLNSLKNERGAPESSLSPCHDTQGALPKADMQEPCPHTSLE